MKTACLLYQGHVHIMWHVLFKWLFYLWATLTALRWSHGLLNWKLIFTWTWKVSSKKYLFQMVKIWHLSHDNIYILHTYGHAKHIYAPPNSQKADLSSASLDAQNVPFQWHNVTSYFSLIWHKLWERMPPMVMKILSEGVTLFREMMTETDNFTWHKMERGKWDSLESEHWQLLHCPRCGTRAGLHEKNATKDEYTEIQYCFMLTSWAFVQHCTDCNECELYHSDGKNSSELNKGQIREIMRTGSCYYILLLIITGLNNFHTGPKSVIPNIPDEIT